MKKVLVFGASSSKNSINKKLAIHAATQLNDVEIQIIDLNDFEMPLFSIDKEAETGIPQPAYQFKKMIQEVDGIVVSFAEHNGSFTAVFKNLFDWTSRIEKKMWEDKPMLAMATSPGARGGKSVLTHVQKDFQYRGGNIVASFSLPSFQQNFSETDGITDSALKEDLGKQIEVFQQSL